MLYLAALGRRLEHHGRAGNAWPESRGRARELLRNSLRTFSDRTNPKAMQLGLRFAAAKLLGLRTDRGSRNLVEPSGTSVARGADHVPGGFLSSTGRSVVE